MDRAYLEVGLDAGALRARYRSRHAHAVEDDIGASARRTRAHTPIRCRWSSRSRRRSCLLMYPFHSLLLGFGWLGNHPSSYRRPIMVSPDCRTLQHILVTHRFMNVADAARSSARSWRRAKSRNPWTRFRSFALVDQVHDRDGVFLRSLAQEFHRRIVLQIDPGNFAEQIAHRLTRVVDLLVPCRYSCGCGWKNGCPFRARRPRAATPASRRAR